MWVNLNFDPEDIGVRATTCEITYLNSVTIQIQGGTRRYIPAHGQGIPQRNATPSAKTITAQPSYRSADKSLARPTYRCRRTESIMLLEIHAILREILGEYALSCATVKN
jgi:hypothetical protein